MTSLQSGSCDVGLKKAGAGRVADRHGNVRGSGALCPFRVAYFPVWVRTNWLRRWSPEVVGGYFGGLSCQVQLGMQATSAS